MLVNADVKGLEVVVAAELSQDKVLKDEVNRQVNFHALNQERFGLPDRVTAKRFIFKLLYGATAFGYTTDSDFIGVGFNQKRWQSVISEFYAKYEGIKKWHIELENRAKIDGYLTIPSGRYFTFQPEKKSYGWKWPITLIKNYPVQGFGADLVMLARIEAFKEFKRLLASAHKFQDGTSLHGEFIQTIHDSLVFDIPNKKLDNGEDFVYTISSLCKNAVEKVPNLCREHFKYDFSLPLTSEILVGPNKKDLIEYEPK